MNIALLISVLFLSGEASPISAMEDTYSKSNSEEITGVTKPKNELRLGLCAGYFECVGAQLEYATPKFTTGITSYLVINRVFTQYNALSWDNDRVRGVLGISFMQAFTGLFEDWLFSGSLYIGPELHFKRTTWRVTGGYSLTYDDSDNSFGTNPTFSVQGLYNFY